LKPDCRFEAQARRYPLDPRNTRPRRAAALDVNRLVWSGIVEDIDHVARHPNFVPMRHFMREQPHAYLVKVRPVRTWLAIALSHRARAIYNGVKRLI
jgi:hypothetical protein